MGNTIISLFDYSGNWSRPYREAGFNIIQIDIKLGIDIFTWDYSNIKECYGILAAVPCTDYALSGAKWFAQKDKGGRTMESNKLVIKVKEIIDYFKPSFYAIENPMSRIHKLNPWMGQPRLKFNPYDYAMYDPNPEDSAYQKETWLWGQFNIPAKRPLENPGFLKGIVNKGGCLHNKYGGKSERTKTMRSITPLGFAYAFYEVNCEERREQQNV